MRLAIVYPFQNCCDPMSVISPRKLVESMATALIDMGHCVDVFPLKFENAAQRSEVLNQGKVVGLKDMTLYTSTDQ